MFKVSTYFIKGQLPGVTIEDLINLYKREFKIQSASNILSETDKINFSNNTFKFVIDKFSNKLSSFSNGQLEIIDEGDKYVVYFEAEWTKLFTNAGIIATIVMLYTFFSDGFGLFPFILGIVTFVLLATIGFISTSASFPVYFTNLRNDFERELSSTS